jgi:hypothetical protein
MRIKICSDVRIQAVPGVAFEACLAERNGISSLNFICDTFALLKRLNYMVKSVANETAKRDCMPSLGSSCVDKSFGIYSGDNMSHSPVYGPRKVERN